MFKFFFTFLICLQFMPSLDARGDRVRRAIPLPTADCTNIYNAATSNLLVGTDITVNPAARPNPFTLAASANAKLAAPAYGQFSALLATYLPGGGATQPARINDFLDAICVPGGPVDVAFRYLLLSGRLPPGVNTLQLFKNSLRTAWFTPYAVGTVTSSGFEHTFVGELRGTTLKGMHSWYAMHLGITAGRFTVNNVRPYVPNNPSKIEVGFSWHLAGGGVATKRRSSFLVGTSPAFDIALFSACFFSMPAATNADTCTCTINGNPLTIQVCRASPGSAQAKTVYPK